MITCKTCHKFAVCHSVVMNGADDSILVGSCKHCGYKKEPKTLDESGNKLPFTKIGESRLNYDSWDELGINR